MNRVAEPVVNFRNKIALADDSFSEEVSTLLILLAICSSAWHFITWRDPACAATRSDAGQRPSVDDCPRIVVYKSFSHILAH